MQQMYFFNPVGMNNATASGPGAPGYKWKPQERFCMLGWHWVYSFSAEPYPDYHHQEVIQAILEQSLGNDIFIQACQTCMQQWHKTGRVHVGTLTRSAVFWEGDFRPRHLQRIKRWLNNQAPLLRDKKG